MKKKKTDLRRYSENTIALFLLNGVVNNMDVDSLNIVYVLIQYIISTLAFTFLLLMLATLIGKSFKRRNIPSIRGYIIKQAIVSIVTLLAVFSWLLFQETEPMFFKVHGAWLVIVGYMVMVLTGIIPFLYVRKLRIEETHTNVTNDLKV